MREFAARFTSHSVFNRALIFMQRSDATFVKGRGQWWRQEGRTVRPGARAIRIMAPALERGEYADTLEFTWTRVYDVADTEGAPFAPPSFPAVIAADALVARRLEQLEQWVWGAGLLLQYQMPIVNALVDGMTDGLAIRIRPDLRPSERLAVLAHEIAHVKLHYRHRDRGKVIIVEDRRQHLSQSEAELQAELMAFLLLNLMGIDPSEGAAAYLSNWKASIRALRRHAERCYLSAAAVFSACQRKRYRRLAEKEPGAAPSRPEADRCLPSGALRGKIRA
jgi:hypothetical protein